MGARSGQPRVNPFAYTRDGDRLIVIASKVGAPTNPDWYYNVVANPLVTVEVGTEQFQVQATIPPEPERTRLYDQMATAMPGFAEYQRRTTRQIPVVVLTCMPLGHAAWHVANRVRWLLLPVQRGSVHDPIRKLFAVK